MSTVSFTANLRRHVQSAPAQVSGATVHEILAAYFRLNPQVRGYVLDDQGAVRKHVAIFVNTEPIRDRTALSDPVREVDEIFVVQALSGG